MIILWLSFDYKLIHFCNFVNRFNIYFLYIWVTYRIYNSYKINYKDKDIKKIVQEVVNKALEERKTERGEA